MVVMVIIAGPPKDAFPAVAARSVLLWMMIAIPMRSALPVVVAGILLLIALMVSLVV